MELHFARRKQGRIANRSTESHRKKVKLLILLDFKFSQIWHSECT